MRFPKTERMNTTGFRHGLRVRMGVNGLKGKLLQCQKKDGTGSYWKVRLDNGEWVWPDGLVVEGPGTHVSTCEECAIPFLTTERGAVLCPTHDEAAFGTTTRATEPLDKFPGQRREWDRTHRSKA